MNEQKNENITPKAPENHLPAANPFAGVHTPPKPARVIVFTRLKLFWLIFVVLLASFLFSTGAFLASTFWVHNSSQDLGGSVTPTSQEKSIAGVMQKVGSGAVSVYASKDKKSQELSAGSGFIVTADGYVVTNRHVANGGPFFRIVASDGEQYEDVKLAAVDPANDLAVLKINNKKDFTPIALGDSSTVRLGESVVAIGNSLGAFENTVTNGIISGQGRALSIGDQSSGESENLSGLLQTTAAISQGNSGGPLVNMAGQVVGVNTAIAQGGSNLGFAIPINSVKGMISQLQQTGTFKRAYLGAATQNIDSTLLAEYPALAGKTGALVAQGGVVADGPAAKVGLESGDIILKVNDTDINNKSSVINVLGEYTPGQTVILTILRDDQVRRASVTLAAWPETTPDR